MMKTEKSKDLVRREDAVDAICRRCVREVFCKEEGEQVCDITLGIHTLPSAEQVASKLKNPCNSLLTDDSGECKEQKSKLDLISRADAIARIQGTGYAEQIKDNLIFILRSLPSAEAEKKYIAQITIDAEEVVRRIKEEYDITDGWIPCSERLPDFEGYVLVTIDIGTITDDGTAMEEQTIIAHYSEEDGEDKRFQTLGMGDVFLNKEVTAWMPLPKPYEGGGDE